MIFSSKPSNYSASIDYLSLSISVSEHGFIGNRTVVQYFERLKKLLVRFGLVGLKLEERNAGIFGYKLSFNLMRPDSNGIANNFTSVGLLAYTLPTNNFNEHRKYNAGIFLSLTGLGCYDVDVTKLVSLLIQEKVDFRITRLDIAVDYYYGEISIEQIKEYYHRGLFMSMGRPPSCREYESKVFDVKAGGYTFYVGKLSGAKSFRAYEKGRQLLEEGSEHPFINWVRLEVQFRNKQCEIPIEMVFDLDSALRGAYLLFEEIDYPQTADFFDSDNHVLKLKYKKKSQWMGIDKAVHWAGHSYKRLVMYLRKVGYDFKDICYAIVLQKSTQTLEHLGLDATQLFEEKFNNFQIPKGLRS